MATAAELTFSPYVFASQNAVNAAGPMTAPKYIRNKSGRILYAKIGDYILRNEDGDVRVMKGALFEAEYTAQAAPTAASSLSASAQTATSISLTWTVGSATALPKIYRAGTLIATNAANANTYADTGLTPNTGYAYAIRNVLNEKPAASDATATLYTRPVDIAAAPTMASRTTTSITINWVNTDATAKTEITIDDGLGGAFSVFSTENAGVTSKAITGLTSGRTYIIKLKHKGAVSNLLSSNFSPTLSQATL